MSQIQFSIRCAVMVSIALIVGPYGVMTFSILWGLELAVKSWIKWRRNL